MPQPAWEESGMDMFSPPSANMEILGRGAGARKSKTYIKDQELATLMGFIRGHTRRLMEAFRKLHSRHYTIDIVEELPDGTVQKRTVPHVLSDNEILDIYPVCSEWERMHQEQVDHYASIGGFAVRAASGMMDEIDVGGRRDSSAGADKRAKTGASQVSGTEPKWR